MSDPAKQGTHFWFMTLMASRDGVIDIQVRSGHWSPPQGASRFDAFNELKHQVIKASPNLAGATVVNFDIQPNVL